MLGGVRTHFLDSQSEHCQEQLCTRSPNSGGCKSACLTSAHQVGSMIMHATLLGRALSKAFSARR
eukprot:1149065-Pelagomonas_calceolata.AAC.1